IKFQEEHGKLRSWKYKTNYRNDEMLAEYVSSGGREVSLVDVDHCYWRILFINNVISEKLYEKYKKNRDARVISVGCLNKRQTIVKKKGYEVLEKQVIENPFNWVWNFVCWTTYKVITKAIEACDDNIFAYQSDGIYMPTKYAPKAMSVIRSFDLECKTIKYQIIGRNSNYVVLADEKGKLKRANLGRIRDLMKILPHVDYEDTDDK
ncbi:MAG: hypothetical protein P0116_15955, partial [Candidatus Nitrosocosmicus sp.]|nr:hypothetical protein [Candidatus Nitrosocosmicus sp.]